MEAMVREIVARYGYVYRLTPESGIVKRLRSLKSYRGTQQTLSPLEWAKMVMDVITALGAAAQPVPPPRNPI